jgi:hypothetical protein
VTVKEKKDGVIGVVLGEKVGAAGDSLDRLEQGLIWLRPKDILPVWRVSHLSKPPPSAVG